jgi:hypothetical protein
MVWRLRGRTAATLWVTFVYVACAPAPVGSRSTAAQQTGIAPPLSAWDSYWLSRQVSPPPPKAMFDPLPAQVRVQNLTNGAITDETATHWVIADIRRANAEIWAYRHLRADIYNANVLGPPGLNSHAIEGMNRERANGTVELVGTVSTAPVAAAVVAVPQRTADDGLSDFVIVQVFRADGRGRERITSDGHRERIASSKQAGELWWQLDAGEFRDDPIVGPLWYQAHGWKCLPGASDVASRICALVQPPD